MVQAFRFFDEAQQGSLSESDLVSIFLAADDEVGHLLSSRTVSLAHGFSPRLPGCNYISCACGLRPSWLGHFRPILLQGVATTRRSSVRL